MVQDLVARLLIVAGHLHTQMAAAGVDHDVEIPLVVLIHLDEVVSAAQSADAPFRPQQIHMAGTAQLVQVDLIEIRELVESQLHSCRIEGLLTMYDKLSESEKQTFKKLLLTR